MNEYRLFVQTVYDRSVGFYDAYGISVFRDGQLIRIVRDITLDRDKAEAVAHSFTENQLEPVHLEQAIEDFLYDHDA